MLIWERFGVLPPKPNEFDVAEQDVVVVLGIRTEKTSSYKPIGLRWTALKPITRKDNE